MGIVRAFAAGLRALARKSSNERELDDEVHHYLEMSAREKMRGGMSRSDAERAARIELGGIDAAKEGVRWIGWEATVESFWKDVQYALRRLRHTPGFTLVAVMSLALGIGANTAIFSVVNAALIRQLPVRDPAGLFYVRGGGPSQVFSYPDFDEIRRNNTVFSAMTAWGGITVSMGSDDNAALASGAIVTGNYFDLLGVHAVLGRVIGPADDVTPGDHPVIVLGDALWQRRLQPRPRSDRQGAHAQWSSLHRDRRSPAGVSWRRATGEARFLRADDDAVGRASSARRVFGRNEP
jgi:hypothetical protein